VTHITCALDIKASSVCVQDRMSLPLTEEEAAEVDSVLSLLDNLKDSVEKYYDWAELLQTEFREMKARVSALEARLDGGGGCGSDVCVPGSEFGEEDAMDDCDDLVGRLERLRGV